MSTKSKKVRQASITPIVAYRWREGSVFNDIADPQEIGEALDKLSEQNGGGPVKPEQIVEAAQSMRSPLHRLFEWDDEKAAFSFRKEQARKLTQHLVVVQQVPGKGRTQTRAYVSVSTVDEKERGYVHVSKAAGYDVIDRARGELDAWCRRYAGVKELTPLVRAVYGVLGVNGKVKRKTA